jgi:hypothetical protein
VWQIAIGTKLVSHGRYAAHGRHVATTEAHKGGQNSPLFHVYIYLSPICLQRVMKNMKNIKNNTQTFHKILIFWLFTFLNRVL